MSGKKLESFKISETQKPTIKHSKKPASSREAESEKYSVGFRRIETLIEEQDPQEVSGVINDLLQKLEELQRSSRSKRDLAAIKKAIVAVERTADLLDYLFQTKASMST